jgi:hypothetical protein
MEVFLSNLRPASVRAKLTERYKAEIGKSFKQFCPEARVAAHPLYAAIYYFHQVPSQQDADNISKPILDSLNGLAYGDDRLVKLRQAAIFDLRSDPLTELDLSNVPAHVLGRFLEMLDSENHVIYVEIGRLSFKQIQFGNEIPQGA